MRSYPSDKNDQKELEHLNPEPWMVDALKLNPSYVFWGPHEDYMIAKGGGWNSPIFNNGWNSMKDWDLDDLNEVVNFYFQIDRESKKCQTCNGIGEHPDAQWVSESFYQHCSPFTNETERERQVASLMDSFGGGRIGKVHGRGNYPPPKTIAKYGEEFKNFCESMRDGHGYWSDDLTQDELDALKENRRSFDGPFGHDAINRHILVGQRCKRYGIPTKCPDCGGHGYNFTAPKAHLNLILWVIHPRKGCSRGVEVKSIQESDMPKVKEYLATAAKRNANRFRGVM
jgi:hypothetical protein